MLTTHTEHVQLWACFFSTHSRISSDESACVYYSPGIISSPIHMIPVICSFIPYQKNMVSGDGCKWMGERIHFQMCPNSEARTVRSFQQHGTFFPPHDSHARSSWRIARVLGAIAGDFWVPSKMLRETPENPVNIYLYLYLITCFMNVDHFIWNSLISWINVNSCLYIIYIYIISSGL